MAAHIHILYGDDELAIAEFVKSQEKELGDPSLAEMNITRLDGKTFNPDELLRVAGSMPFLASRRLVSITNWSGRNKGDDLHNRFLADLEKIPATTIVLLTSVIDDYRDRKKFPPKWLENWAAKHSDRVLVHKPFDVPKGSRLVDWIEKRAKELGGQFSREAAELLMSMVGEEPRQIEQEIHKLLTYVNYKRRVEPDDVEKLTISTAQVSIFEMVDAISDRNKQKALRLLHRLLEEEDPFMILSMIIRQFRILVLVKESMERSGQLAEVGGVVNLSDWQLQKFSGGARRFSLPLLESAYHRLLEVDEMAKTGKMELPLALETFVFAFTS